MFIDTHCHLTDSRFCQDRNVVIANAKKAGIKRIIIPGSGAQASIDGIELAKSRPDVLSAAAGIDPYESVRGCAVGEFLRRLDTSFICAIGECGLDYHAYQGFPAIGKKDDQKRSFEEQALFSLNHNLPLIIHCRDAFDDLFAILDSLPSMPRGVIHCFAGTQEHAKKALQRNLFLGVDGNITYGKKLQAVLSTIELSALLLETDAPYLTPEPHRGQRNEPKYLRLTAKALSKLLQIDEKVVEMQTTINAYRLFFPQQAAEMIQ